MATSKRPTGLGRGLNALLQDVALPRGLAPEDGDVTTSDSGVETSGRLRHLPIETIVANPGQPRRTFDDALLDELADSIRTRGVLQPILVRPASGGDQYEIVAGERRWRAAQRIPLETVPVLVQELSDTEAFEIAIVENVQRRDLSPIEEAEGYQRLMADYGHSQNDLAKLVGKSRSHVANLVRLLELPPSVRRMVDDGDISMGHARALIGHPEAEPLAKRVAAEGLSVREVERLVSPLKGRDRGGERPREHGRGPAKDADTLALQQDLSQALGMAVDISEAGGKGEVRIRFRSLDQLDLLCGRLTARNSGF